MERLPDTWLDRDLPILRAVAEELEETPGTPVDGYRLAARLGMDNLQVARALAALDGDYLTRHTEGSLDGSPDLGVVVRITPAARRAVGLWPTPESITDELLAALDQRIADETEPEQKTRLARVRDAIGGTGRELFIGVAGSVLSRAITGS